MEYKRAAKSDVLLEEDSSHRSALPDGKDFMEVNGLIVRGEAEGMEICVLAMIWQLGGGADGQWRTDETSLIQTSFHMVPKGQKQITDNAFIGNRLDGAEWSGTHTVTHEADKTIWQLQGRQMISSPPYWQVKGEHMGVDLDLTLGGTANAARVYGAWDDLPTAGRGGYENCCWAEGSVTVNGHKYTIENGWGDHGVLTFGENYDQVAGMREGYYYVWAWHEDMQLFFWVMPSSGIGSGYAYFPDGREYKFGPGEIRVSVLERWTDPMTSIDAPVRWHVNMSTPDMVDDFNVAGVGRSIYCVPVKTGITARYCFSSRATGRAFLANGESVQFDDTTAYVEWGKSLLPFSGGTPESN